MQLQNMLYKMIYFLVAAIAPEISQSLRDVQTVAGKNATFELEVTGNPKPEVQW